MSISMEMLQKKLLARIPCLGWAPRYNSEKLLCDTIAGFTVGLTVVPQALAYATLAGLEPQYGLYSAFVGCFVYAIFGSCKDITIGPTALMALMTYQQLIDGNPDYAVLLCFLTGLVQLIMALLNLGVLVDFISIPVTVGFTSATSVIIATSQLKSLLGIKMVSNNFLDTIYQIIKNIHQTRWPDCILGCTCIFILLLLRKFKEIKTRHLLVNRVLWLISTSRNALVVIGCSMIAYAYGTDTPPFQLTGTVRPGLPSIGPPPFSTHHTNETVPFETMLTQLGTSIILVPIISVLGNVAIAKAFAGGGRIDATQELLTLALCNVIGSFVASMPVTGSFSRSAVNHASGVRTPFGGIVTGTLVIAALIFLTPYFVYIPKSALAAVIVSAVIFMIEYEVIEPMWRSSKKDLMAACATFVFCLIVGVECGILIGVGVNLVFLVYPSARPEVYIDRMTTNGGCNYVTVTPGNSLYFPAIEFIKSSISKATFDLENVPVVIDCRYILGADFTAAKGIASLIEEFTKRKQSLYFLNTKNVVIKVFKGAFNYEFNTFDSRDELEAILDDDTKYRDNENSTLLELKSIK